MRSESSNPGGSGSHRYRGRRVWLGVREPLKIAENAAMHKRKSGGDRTGTPVERGDSTLVASPSRASRCSPATRASLCGSATLRCDRPRARARRGRRPTICVQCVAPAAVTGAPQWVAWTPSRVPPGGQRFRTVDPPRKANDPECRSTRGRCGRSWLRALRRPRQLPKSAFLYIATTAAPPRPRLCCSAIFAPST
jgi:hypothetical protein